MTPGFKAKDAFSSYKSAVPSAKANQNCTGRDPARPWQRGNGGGNHIKKPTGDVP